jgi:hypothetical protein
VIRIPPVLRAVTLTIRDQFNIKHCSKVLKVTPVPPAHEADDTKLI